ncbi:MAG: hypothetical protein U0Q22_07295 [Acidimicrobiales bacterium]
MTTSELSLDTPPPPFPPLRPRHPSPCDAHPTAARSSRSRSARR